MDDKWRTAAFCYTQLNPLFTVLDYYSLFCECMGPGLSHSLVAETQPLMRRDSAFWHRLSLPAPASSWTRLWIWPQPRPKKCGQLSTIPSSSFWKRGEEKKKPFKDHGNLLSFIKYVVIKITCSCSSYTQSLAFSLCMNKNPLTWEFFCAKAG